MKPNTNIDERMLENTSSFQGAFFERFALRHAPQPLELTPTLSKNYLFPTFYDDVTSALAIFLCSYKKAAALMPHAGIRPVSMLGGRSLVVISCYEYKKVLGIPPYNEVALNIPVLVPPSWPVPILPVLASRLFPHFGYYCFGMPVTSLENQVRGIKIWGLPKTLHEIRFHHSETRCRVEVFEKDQGSFIDLEIRKSGKSTPFDVAANLYSVKDGELLQSTTHFKGTFQVIKNNGLLWGGGRSPQDAVLKLGDGPHAEILRRLEIDPRPFQLRFCASMMACFDLPNKNYQPPFKLAQP